MHLARIFGKDAPNQIKRVFGDAWDKAAADAARSRSIGGTNTTVRDDYDLLGVNHFFEIFDRHFDKLFSVVSGYPADRPRPIKSKFLGNLKAIKDGRDPISHPVEEEIPYDEAFGLLLDAKQVLLALGLEMEANEIAALCEELVGGPPAPSVLRRLPTQDSIYLSFVGRAGLLEQLDQCFRDPDNRRSVLAGDGGKGKSAIAYRYAQSLAQHPGRFQLIVWLSAKRRRFEGGKTVTISDPDFTCTEDAVIRLLVEYGAIDEDFQRPISEQKKLLLEFLNEYPAFVIADDIDTLFEDADVISLFTHEIPHTRSAVLLTSRRDIPGIRSFPVKGFEPDEAEAFIRSRMELYGLEPRDFTPEAIQKLALTTDNSPLYLDDLLRLARVIGLRRATEVWDDKGGEQARKYALQREMENLPNDAKKVLVAAAVADGPVSAAELENLLDFSEDRLIASLSELHTLFLFAKPKIVEGEQRFEINLNTKKLVREVEGSSDFYARIERASKALRGQLPEVGQGVVAALIRQAQLRLNALQHGEAEKILLGAIDKYPQSADLYSFLGYAYKRMGRVADARKYFESAFKLKGRKKDMFLQWVRMEIVEKEWSKAISAADKALRVLPNSLELLERKVYAERQAGFDFHGGLHREKAERMWRDAVDDATQALKSPDALSPGERYINASLFCSLVICLDMLGEFRQRDSWFQRWAAEHPDDPQVQRQYEFLTRKYGTGFTTPV